MMLFLMPWIKIHYTEPDHKIIIWAECTRYTLYVELTSQLCTFQKCCKIFQDSVLTNICRGGYSIGWNSACGGTSGTTSLDGTAARGLAASAVISSTRMSPSLTRETWVGADGRAGTGRLMISSWGTHEGTKGANLRFSINRNFYL